MYNFKDILLHCIKKVMIPKMSEKSAISDSFVQTQISKYLLYGIKIKYYLLSVSVLVFNHLHSFTEQTKKF